MTTRLFTKNKNIKLCIFIIKLLAKEFSNIFTKLIPKGFLSLARQYSINNFSGSWISNNFASYSFAKTSDLNESYYAFEKAADNKLVAFAEAVNQVNHGILFFKNQASKQLNSVASASLGSFGFKSLLKKELNYNWLPRSTKVTAQNWLLPEDLNKIISAFFKSIYCLISKPKFINTPDKIIIEILYYITIPDHNIFKWYNFIYNASSIAQPKLAAQQASKLVAFAEVASGQSLKNKQKLIRKIRRKKSIKTILLKNFLIKKTLFNLNNSNIANLYLNKFVIFFKFLSSYFSKPIEFNLIRLHKSDYDSNILAQLFILILKKKNIRIAINKIYNKNTAQVNGRKQASVLPEEKDNVLSKLGYASAIIAGLYIHIGGRLMREPIIPRLTTKKFEKGAIATGKVNFLDSARITKKNKKGAFTIKIAYAQNLI